MEMWKMCPIFKGVGIGNVVIAFMCISYFCVIVSWAVFYMVSSFNSTFPCNLLLPNAKIVHKGKPAATIGTMANA